MKAVSYFPQESIDEFIKDEEFIRRSLSRIILENTIIEDFIDGPGIANDEQIIEQILNLFGK